ncbi:MAG: hydrogenase expression/formation protein HypE [Epsilonproteobacteria bacterium]|nr:hydrogenase expression/formation protein HypE [Campylobacterota bacterium]NPA57622.1 hydrogenase expression/formation protein HypE [Campylobacterota bacterium]
MEKIVSLAMGSGGKESWELIERIFRHLGNDLLKEAEDGTPLPSLQNPLFTTDSFTVSPLFFPGGDIGKLAVAGACNDLAMMGAQPRFLSLGLIIEEGLELRQLERILRSMKRELALNGAQVVTGDTKVVPKGGCDGLYIGVSALGERKASISQRNIEEGDLILLSGDIGRHGATIFAAREGIELWNDLESDCRSLWPIVEELLESGATIKAMRDATRGGIAAVLNEWATAQNVEIEIEEEKVSVRQGVQGICEILGLDPMVLANEGTFLLVSSRDEAPKILEILRSHNPEASIIGEVKGDHPQRVVLRSPWGTRRFLDMPSGEILPRIC